MKNKLTDLNDYLFAQLERLGDESLSDEAIANEIKRTSAVVSVADKIVDNARLQLDAVKFASSAHSASIKRMPASLGLPAGGIEA